MISRSIRFSRRGLWHSVRRTFKSGVDILQPTADGGATLQVAALLDKHRYARASAKASDSKSGLGAAQRILKGQGELAQVLRQLSCPVVLHGHGVPVELIQDHVDTAQTLLAADKELTSLQWNQESPALTAQTSDGRTTQVPWNHDNEPLTHSVTLYLTVMHRISQHLGTVLFGDDLYPSTEPWTARTLGHHWSVEIQHDTPLRPKAPAVVMLVPPPSLDDHVVRLRVMGRPSNTQNHANKALTMCYTASFE